MLSTWPPNWPVLVARVKLYKGNNMYTIQLTKEEVNLVVTGLAELPLKFSQALVNKIITEITNQDSAQNQDQVAQ